MRNNAQRDDTSLSLINKRTYKPRIGILIIINILNNDNIFIGNADDDDDDEYDADIIYCQ